jgi:hypothetical protein
MESKSVLKRHEMLEEGIPSGEKLVLRTEHFADTKGNKTGKRRTRHRPLRLDLKVSPKRRFSSKTGPKWYLQEIITKVLVSKGGNLRKPLQRTLPSSMSHYLSMNLCFSKKSPSKQWKDYRVT